MKELEIHAKIKRPFGNLYRDKTVLIVGTDDDCKAVLSEKPSYPKGISRLPGGGVKEGESPRQAAVRETKEELKVNYPIKDFSLIASVLINATDFARNKYVHSIFIYHLYINSDPIRSGGDITGLRMMSSSEMKKLARSYSKISKNLKCIDESENFWWRDYGKIYGPIHKEVANMLARSKKQHCKRQL